MWAPIKVADGLKRRVKHSGRMNTPFIFLTVLLVIYLAEFLLSRLFTSSCIHCCARCFVALMDKRECNFHTDQRGMHSQLLSLEKLLRLLDPQLWTCFKKLESLNFFCCFRWVLILFKREFSFEEVRFASWMAGWIWFLCRVFKLQNVFFLWQVLRLWEALWANYRTEHFHLYMCIATLMDCRKEILENVTDFDMLIKYCVDLSHRIPLLHIMRQAEVLAIHAKPFEKEIMGGLDPTDGHTWAWIPCMGEQQSVILNCYFLKLKLSARLETSSCPSSVQSMFGDFERLRVCQSSDFMHSWWQLVDSPV